LSRSLAARRLAGSTNEPAYQTAFTYVPGFSLFHKGVRQPHCNRVRLANEIYDVTDIASLY
jgi:hypothetical protein